MGSEEGIKNLIPVTERSEDEVREMRRKGGIRSGETRKKKKELKERLGAMIDLLGKKVAEQEDDPEVKKAIEENGYDVYKAVLTLNKKGTSASELTNLLRLVWGYRHGMPEQTNVNKNLNLNVNLEEMTDDELDNEIKRTTEKLNS